MDNDNFLFEGRGVPNIVKKIINEKILPLLDNLKIEDNIFKIDLTKYIPELILKLKINIKISDDDTYNGNVNFYDIIKYGFNNAMINIYVRTNEINIRRITLSIFHELTHIYELSIVKDYIKDTCWKNLTGFYDFKKDNKNLGLFKYFIDLVYISFSHEIRARVASVYDYFFVRDTINKEELIEILKKSYLYDHYLSLKNFEYKKFINQYSNDIDTLINFVNMFNKYYKIYIKVENIKDIKKYFKRWNEHFIDCANKYYNKMIKVIDEVIKDKLIRENKEPEFEGCIEINPVTSPYFTEDDKLYIENKIKEILCVIYNENMEYSTEFPISEGMIISYNKYIKESLNIKK